MIWVLAAALVVAAFWGIARFHLDGEGLERYDAPVGTLVNDAPSPGNADVVAFVSSLVERAMAAAGKARLALIRTELDRLGEQADMTGIRVVPVTVGHCAAEWVLAEGTDGRGRLLYLHGGGFTAGSPRSHRRITTELARRTGLAVLALDYRLMPEHGRRAMLDDCRSAYRWLLEHGPEGPGPAGPVFVAGDSAGGNLTLALIAWIRDQGLRQVDGAIALSPLTDATFASPSLARNVDSDPMLGRMARLIGRVPRPLMLWSTWLQNRIRPTDPQLSPLRGDLAGLPPVLIQASEAEILIDDARRYVNRAREAGSPAELETWRGMVHVWPAFGPDLPETNEAFERMERFVERALASRTRADAA